MCFCFSFSPSISIDLTEEGGIKAAGSSMDFAFPPELSDAVRRLYHLRRGPLLSPGPLQSMDDRAELRSLQSSSDTYRQIYQGHDNASAVTNSEGLTVYFDPDTNDVLGFTIAAFSEYYKKHSTPEGEFEVSLPAKVPPSIEEEMDFDAETIRSGVRIAEFY